MHRTFLFRLHLWLGLITALFILVICLTGSLLMFTGDLESLTHPHLFSTNPHPNEQRITLQEAVDATRAHFPDAHVKDISFNRGDDKTLMLWINEKGKWVRCFVDPYSGEVIGVLAKTSSIDRWLYRLHYQLYLGRTGGWIVGIMGILMTVSCVTGVIIYWRMFKTLWLRPIRWTKSLRMVMTDLHNWLGLVSLVFNAFIAISGSYLIYLYFIKTYVGEEGRPKIERSADEEYFPKPSHDVDQLVNRAITAFQEFRPNYVEFAAYGDQEIIVEGGVRGSWFRKASVYFQHQTGELTRIVDGRQGRSVSWKIGDWARPLHYGAFGGLTVQILYFIGGLTPCLLALSGAVMWWERRSIKSRRQKRKADAAEPRKMESEEREESRVGPL